LNIRELELPKPDGGSIKGEINEVESSNKDEDMDASERQDDIDIETEEDEVGTQAGLNSSTIQKQFIPTNAF
uniref:Uncharacterized protein n=1 Tax=Gongylonema pulchrum TaxID=637853 RepID=A0A183DL72_9BILA